ncbi:MAG: hypothetical protein A3F31_05095 [Candidatus Levybacteria bacterium RIFCSPHIGHO2_12_FULL_38_12]|nr:MAG: hypothetical protein A2770_00290 [Candidatus Levybacteria bacterium RIFCSPHIGHO2_01_FULL_38_12]OGH21714.1 MAG: hypothetical protein A3D75_00810 [Candidatus Levybacteria bacterium RIFCSPHIGHO2_02_FULL_37_18]OGH22628.1 MAG: hypothetical protein A3F31_05095 [Candidatus Levybacteria bacterium RIFCSPHIGHO2_12_FULL_38_12]OGH33335.1 MAG: hypothetical protein A3A47_03760 [Candidatus Levybacteria bacterium RIFCSPLOWO2_01_FULL_37_20]OGH43724.1 MAG: hypothetical protein A3J14_04310 [Candidatus Lev
MEKETYLNNCPLCGSRVINGMYGLSGYLMCNNCLLGWKKKLKSTEYVTEYYVGKSTLARRLFTPLQNFFYSIRQWYAGRQKKKLWIDVGAGEGGFLKTVKAKRRIGVEISSSGKKMMKESGLDTLSDKEFIRTKGLGADVISFWHVLEHVEKPEEYLDAARNNLKKGGKIIIGVPNIDSFEFKFSKQYWFHLQPQFHLWHYSPSSLKKLLQKSKFKINTIDYWSIEHHLTGVLQTFINKFSGSKENVLHRLVKRSAGGSKVRLGDIFWSGFFLTLGAPIIVLFWTIGSIFRRSGTIVVVASTGRKTP